MRARLTDGSTGVLYASLKRSERSRRNLGTAPMLTSTLTFTLRHRRGLTCGAMLMALSPFGQT
jgi:hypothetical protein